MENAIAVANYFVGRGLDSGIEVTPMKVIKLVYIAHGWYLGLFGKPLLEDGVQAWQYGPVVQSVYDKFKEYGSGAIRKKGTVSQLIGSKTPEVEDKSVRGFLGVIWDQYGKFSGIGLSEMTHRPGTPWDIIWNDFGKHERFARIPNDLIQAHYQSLINERQPAAARV